MISNEKVTKVVTIDNFVRAESDMAMARYVAAGGFSQIMHLRVPVPLDKQDIIRMNRDTLYSVGIFDLNTPVTIIKPDPGQRYQSMMLINQDHYQLSCEYQGGEFELTKGFVGTRYVLVLFRTFMDPVNPTDILEANHLQDEIRWRQAAPGKFEIPNWDINSLKMVRDAVNILASTKADAAGFFGQKSKINPIDHLLGAAYGWGGLAKEDAFYINGVPKLNDGEIPHTLTMKDVPVDGFWSITLYNANGFMDSNDRGVNSYNSVTSAKNSDGSVTIHFGGDPTTANYLPITKGWNYVIRLYKPRKEILEEKWPIPDALPIV